MKLSRGDGIRTTGAQSLRVVKVATTRFGTSTSATVVVKVT